MKIIEDKLRRLGAKRIYLEVAVNNTIALNMYRKIGYKPLHRLPGYYHGVDGLLMVKELYREKY